VPRLRSLPVAAAAAAAAAAAGCTCCAATVVHRLGVLCAAVHLNKHPLMGLHALLPVRRLHFSTSLVPLK